ncbi:Flp pilus assembly protein TadG [Sphingomonas vulcanisoli]|uniref:Flp pilus assembly protein TadG n=1 Tax=Sphingomonas vulcanisoli TaxID=1658060 RepID=A0ABX0TVF2_9SPHN|nr:Flp pilus assembly protein TadG [Sphingomonas vulcanisoli]
MIPQRAAGGQARTRSGIGRDDSGAAALEFALLAIPFFMLLMGIIEIGLYLVVNLNLSNATAVAARKIRVGSTVATGNATTQSNGATLSPADFKASLCANMVILPLATCTANVQLDLRTLTSYTNASIPNPVNGKSFSTTGFCYYSGVPGQIVEIRSYYLWPVVTPLLWATLSGITNSSISGVSTAGHWLLASATYVFVNEPNGSTINNGSSC